MTESTILSERMLRSTAVEWVAFMHPDDDVRTDAINELLTGTEPRFSLIKLMEMGTDPLLPQLAQRIARVKAGDIYVKTIEGMERRMEYTQLVEIAEIGEPKEIATKARETAEKTAIKYANRKTWGRTDDTKETRLTFYCLEVVQKIIELGEMRDNETFSEETRRKITTALRRLVTNLTKDIQTRAEEGNPERLWALARISKHEKMPQDVRAKAEGALEKAVETAVAAIREKGIGEYYCLGLRLIAEPERAPRSMTDFGYGGMTKQSNEVDIPIALRAMAAAAIEPTMIKYITNLSSELDDFREKELDKTDTRHRTEVMKTLAIIAMDRRKPMSMRERARKALEPEIIQVAKELKIESLGIEWLGKDGKTIEVPRFSQRPVPSKPDAKARITKPLRNGR